jgi:hypothetical protein
MFTRIKIIAGTVLLRLEEAERSVHLFIKTEFDKMWNWKEKDGYSDGYYSK